MDEQMNDNGAVEETTQEGAETAQEEQGEGENA